MRVLVLVALVALAACARVVTTEIGEIQNNAERYEGRTVTVRGTVAEALALPLTDRAAYQVRDRTGEIWVQSQAGAPETGAEVTVTGVVRPRIEINGRNFALVIVEQRRETQ